MIGVGWEYGEGPTQVIRRQGSFPRGCDICKVVVFPTPVGTLFLLAQFQTRGPGLTLVHFVFLFCVHNIVQLTSSAAWMGCGYVEAHCEKTTGRQDSRMP